VEVGGPEPPGGIQIGVLTPGNDHVSQIDEERESSKHTDIITVEERIAG
jgi:hypothetical protein